ncbi:hypothetical protein EG871_14695, partial [Enterococcus faecium]
KKEKGDDDGGREMGLTGVDWDWGRMTAAGAEWEAVRWTGDGGEDRCGTAEGRQRGGRGAAEGRRRGETEPADGVAGGGRRRRREKVGERASITRAAQPRIFFKLFFIFSYGRYSRPSTS